MHTIPVRDIKLIRIGIRKQHYEWKINFNLWFLDKHKIELSSKYNVMKIIYAKVSISLLSWLWTEWDFRNLDNHRYYYN